MKRMIFLGVVLIVVGLAALVLNFMGIETRLLAPGLLFLGAIGGAFLAVYVYTRWYGFLIPGCILASLWLSIVSVEFLPLWPEQFEGAIIMGGLGVSFFAIYLVDRFYAGRRRIWPVWPGVGLIIFSILIALSGYVAESITATLFVAGPGVVLFIIYLWRKIYPLLIPACYMMAIGLVIPMLDILSDGTQQQEMLAVALVMGSIAVASVVIYVVDKLYTRASNWWPWVPAAVCLVVGGLFALTGLEMGLTIEQWQALGENYSRLWPFGLIVLGLWLVLRFALRGRRETRDITPPDEG